VVPRRRVSSVARLLLLAFFLGIIAPLATMPANEGVAAPSPLASDFSTQHIEGDPLTPGTTAIVRANGSCLRLRPGPSLDGTPVDCIPEGSTVDVLEGVQQADGYRWQRVQWRGQIGWVADEFLRPFTAPPTTGGSCQQTTSTAPGFNGGLHTGGISLVLWGGGTLAGMENRAASEGCRLRSVWAVNASGNMVGYLSGVPDFVNRAWFELFPGGYVPSGQGLVVDCRPGEFVASATSQIAATRTIPLPAPSASAPTRTGSQQAPRVSARAAVIVDHDSGEILYEKDAHQPLPPASLTKIATAIVAIEGADLDAWVTSNVDGREMPGSSLMGLRRGDCFTLRDMVYGLMLPSGNDAALAIGQYLDRNDSAFVHQMNTLVSRLGLTGSRFTDPHGLGSSTHRMSAYDIAMLSRYGMTLPAFREVVTAPSWTAVGSRQMSLFNVNSFIRSYPDADGVKTGFTNSAGRTLSASAVRNGKRLYVVVLNAPDRYEDAEKLLDWAFANHRWN
jgi:hypothetical protein